MEQNAPQTGLREPRLASTSDKYVLPLRLFEVPINDSNHSLC